ncbi:MAG: glycosyltransferase [Methylocystis silviterrae]|uniref:glycosyltransferase n=1 Tax=Methylocystis silviterrae TaxID=2743612 RepID=UPI003C76C4C6
MAAIRHCIITEEYSGLNKSGGIGACSNGLANALVSVGYSVDVLVTDLSCSAINTHTSKKRVGFPNFVFLSDIARRDKAVVAPTDAITKSFSVFRFLKDQNYALLHFNEWMGSGYFCAMARRQGLLHAQVITHLHGSSDWVRRHNLYFAELEDYEREAIESAQIENSDAVISPSAYLLEYYEKSGIKLPQAKQINWILPQWILADSSSLCEEPFTTRAMAPHAVSELIFFGRHERRKGFEIFVDAVAQLPRGLQPDLTFIGRFDRIGREFSGSHVFRKLPSYPGRIRFFDQFNQEEALSFILHARSALCVMPSLIENSPCIVGECFTNSVPFLTTGVGGTPELIDVASREHCLVPPTSLALAKAIERCMTEGLPALRSTLASKAIVETWTDYIKSLEDTSSSALNSASLSAQQPLVSVCMTHYERPELLRIAVDALMAQTYDNIEIIVVDDGSKRPEAHKYLDTLEQQPQRFPIKIVRSANRYLGAARNLAVSHAKGEYLLFHDDDNFAEPNEIEVFVAAATRSGFDILTSQYWVFREGAEKLSPMKKKIMYFPIGIGGVFSFFRNRFGDANALFKRSVFEALGGFTELRGVGWEDWELFLRAFLRGAKIGIVPEPLFNYRLSPIGMLATGNVAQNYERIFAVADVEQPRLNADLLRYAQRHAVQQQMLDRLWSDLEKLPATDLHKQLIALEPGSSEARSKLSDLAFALGRVADGLEIGVMDFHHREKMLAMASQFARPSAVTVRHRTFVKPTVEEASRAFVLSGWAFVHEGRALILQSLVIDNKKYATVAHTVSHRADVISHHSLASDEPLGFTLVAVQEGQQWRGLARYAARRRPLPTTTDVKIELLDAVHKSFKAHIDEIDWCGEAMVEVPKSVSAPAHIIVQSTYVNSILLRGLNGSYLAGERVSPNMVKFECPANVDTLTFVLPRNGKTDIIFESM